LRKKTYGIPKGGVLKGQKVTTTSCLARNAIKKPEENIGNLFRIGKHQPFQSKGQRPRKNIKDLEREREFEKGSEAGLTTIF